VKQDEKSVHADMSEMSATEKVSAGDEVLPAMSTS
jgi:hypothetical protein